MKSIGHARTKPRCLFVLYFVLLVALFSWGMAWGEEIPTIEKVTGGKLKAGDLVTKDNVDLVKDLLPPSAYECVKRGMVLILAPPTPVEKTLPAYFLEATKKNRGKAVMGQNNVVYTKDGKKWIGGFPFPEPQTGTEAMANYRFGALSYGCDDFNYYVRMDFVNSKGEAYKYNQSWYRKMFVQPRLLVPPLGVIPGHEAENYRSMIFFLEPQDIAGLSQLFVRYYDDTARPDDGYLYLPALKRTRRISATNWQDNMAGTDLTWSDADGFADPFGGWNFKLVEKKLYILPGDNNPNPKKRPDGTWDPGIKYDVGVKFPRLQWELRPTYVVEATPKQTHVYGKKIIYLDEVTFKSRIVEMYDHQMKLWKHWLIGCTLIKGADGNNYSCTTFPHGYDFQIDHMTRLTTQTPAYNTGVKVEDYTLKKMLEMGK